MTSKRTARQFGSTMNVNWTKDLRLDRHDCEIKMVRMDYRIQDDWREAVQLVYDVDDDNWSLRVNASANGPEGSIKGGNCLFVATALEAIIEDVNATIMTQIRYKDLHVEQWVKEIP